MKKDRNETCAEMLEGELDERKEEIIASKKDLAVSEKLEADLRWNAERVRVECDELSKKSAHIEARCELLAEKLKSKLRTAMPELQEEERVDVSETRKK